MRSVVRAALSSRRLLFSNVIMANRRFLAQHAVVDTPRVTTPTPPAQSNASSASTTLTIHESAIQQIKQLNQGLSDTERVSLRLMVEGGGCSGFQYMFELVPPTSVTDDDVVFGESDSMVIVDKVTLDLVKGSRVTYQDEMISATFVVEANPNADSSCGCKQSFALKMG
eukprot:c15764_g1_i1.p1 GENE.c15764_g1_i1~~c15764_g1_i1.p1  ORF type:complete len:169 (-),score=26.02 c15764_g1_i1:36-542(-)